MTSEPLSFFTIDHGTASTAAALVAPVGGRFRLLGAAAAARGVEVEGILADLVARVVATAPEMLPESDGWPSWARLEVATHRPLGAVCVGGSERRADEMVGALRNAGWEVHGRFAGPRVDPLALTAALLDPSVTALALAAGDPLAADDRAALPSLVPVLAAAAARRPDLRVVLFGGAAAWTEAFPAARVRHGPATGPETRGGASGAARFAMEAAAEWSSDVRPRLPDGHQALVTGASSMAALLDRPIDAVDVGHAASLRAVATPDGEAEWILRAEAALVPVRALVDDAEAERILRWCALPMEAFALRDRLRELGLSPWRDASGGGARIRLAALRAALSSLSGTWRGVDADEALHRRTTATRRRGGRPRRPGPARPTTPTAEGSDLVLCTGGAFASVPAPIAALALVDGLRRPGARTLLWDHARLLAPIGTIAAGSDRRRLLADLVDDAFVPLGSAVIIGDLRPSHPATLRLTSPVGASETTLGAGTLRTVDLPPGVAADVEIEARDPFLLGVRARHVAMALTGGLAGLLVDARETPLRLHDRNDRRQAQLDGWERTLWPGLDP